MLKVGDKAPDFALADQSGTTHSLDELLQNGELVVYFYPADFTPVCTAEACVFRDNYDEVSALGVQIVGVSPQSESSHERFADRYELPFPLLADTSKKMIRAWGVDGPFGIGVRRVTYLVGQDKIIKRRAIADFTVTNHTKLLKAVIEAA